MIEFTFGRLCEYARANGISEDSPIYLIPPGGQFLLPDELKTASSPIGTTALLLVFWPAKSEEPR